MPEVSNPKLRVPSPPVEAAESALPYAELEVSSNFSFLRGASHPDELVYRAAELGYRAIAITDVNSLAGVVRAHDAAKQAGLKLLIGARLCLEDGPEVLVWAGDRAAYGRLCRLLTIGKRRAEKGQCRLTVEDLAEYSAGLWAATVPGNLGSRISNLGSEIRDIFGPRLSIAASCCFGPDDRTHLENLAGLSHDTGVPLLATNAVHYHDPSRRMLQDVLTCIRHGCTIQQAGYRLFPNGERYLKSPQQMHRLFEDYPQAIRRGIEIADACNFSLDELRYEYPDEVAPAGMRPIEYLSQLTWAGAAERYPNGIPPKVRQLIEHELELIERLKYEAYFLTVHDVVRFARSRGILCQGRGSAANSAVCYCIGVTSVDPERIDMLFERFVSAARGEPPDIDVDFEHERREEVLQYIYGKYGRERAGMTAEVISYRGRSAVRDVGKALGLSLDQVDQMARSLAWWDRGKLDDQRLRQAGLDPSDRAVRLVVQLVGQLLGFPRHLSQHVGGMVMTRGPLCELVPIENAAMPDRTVIEWDKDDIDTLGILKVDCLGLGMLTAINKALVLVNEARRHEGTKARSEGEGREGMEKANGRDKDVSRFDRLAEGDGVGQAGVSRDQGHAGFRAIRADQPDAPGGGVGAVQHRRGLCAAVNRRLHQVPPCGQGIAGGTLDADGDRHIAGDAADQSTTALAPGGIRPRPARPDPQPGSQFAASPLPGPPHHLTPSPSSLPSCLRAFVPPCLPQRAFRSVPPCLQLHTIPPEDPAVYDMICRADTVGVFQIESRAQMSMLPRLRPRNFYDLVIEVAIVRPGPIQGNMVHPYLRRRNGEESVTYPSEALRQVLEKTLGVPLFQEQAMRIAMVAAGFSAEEADQLRRAMAAWRRHGALDTFHDKIVDGMLANGYTRQFAEQCFMQIRGFGEYGFPESHAASFALLVYASAWLKRYHPAAFCAALLNSQPMGFYAPAQIVRDAREHGVEVRAVDVNCSEWECTLEATERRSDEATKEKWGWGGPAVRLGLRQVRGLRQDHARRIEEVRRDGGPFTSIAQMHAATGLPRHAMQRLAEADAFGSLGLSRRQALWEALALPDEPSPMFPPEDQPPPQCLPLMPQRQEVAADYTTTGLSLKKHPMELLRAQMRKLKVMPACRVRETAHGAWVKVAGLVLVRQRPATASGVVFVTLEDETGIVNLVIWPKVFERFRAAATHSGLLLAEGRLQRQGEVIHVVASKLADHSDLLPGYQLMSRDFH